MCIHIHIYIYICVRVHVYMCIYIYTYIEREIDREIYAHANMLLLRISQFGNKQFANKYVPYLLLIISGNGCNHSYNKQVAHMSPTQHLCDTTITSTSLKK